MNPAYSPTPSSTTPWSLARYQWRGLALLTLLGLSLVSALAYSLTAYHLKERQALTLQSMSKLVNYLLSEKFEAQRNSSHFQGLDDHFSGHSDISLQIFAADQRPIYRTRHQVEPSVATTLNFKLSGDFAHNEAQLALDKTQDTQLLKHLAWVLGISSFLGATVFAFGGWLLIRHGMRPVAYLIEQTQGLDVVDFRRRLDSTGQPEELQPLVEHFNAVLQRLEQEYRQLEEFSANVAHELNTPLATLLTSTEIALRKQRDPDALYDLLGSNLEELQRISSMVKDMLFLARADDGAKARRVPVPSLYALVQSVIEYHEALLEETNLQVQIEGDGAGEFDPPLLKRALSNLLSNALRYAYPASTITVRIETHEQTVRLSLSNQGDTIASEQLARIFERFYRISAARADSDSHHGLGLSIVAAVAQMHGGKTFAYCDANGLTHIGMLLKTDSSKI